MIGVGSAVPGHATTLTGELDRQTMSGGGGFMATARLRGPVVGLGFAVVAAVVVAGVWNRAACCVLRCCP